MNCKRLSAALLALAMASTLPAFAAGDTVDAPLEDDQTLLIAPAPEAEMPRVEVPAPNGGYSTVITINGEALESFDFSREVPGWGSQTVTWKVNELDTVPTGYVPMRAVTQADHGSCYWYAEEDMSWFSLEGAQIDVYFGDLSVAVNGQPLEGVSALLLNGVTYLPVSVIDGLEGYSVTDLSADGVERYEIATPNGTPLMKLALQLQDLGEMGGMKSSPAEMEEFQGAATGFQAAYMTEGVVFLPMMTSPDTLILGKAAEGKLEDLQTSLEAYRKAQEETFSWYLSQNLPKVEDARFVTEGDWFLFYIGENADEVVAAFQAGVKGLE